MPLAIATALTGLFVFALVWRFDVIQASALYGLRLELPPLTTVAGLAHVLAFFGWTFATIELIADRGGIRLAGYGMVLLALGGYEQASPVELCLSVLGLVAVAVGELRALPYADRNVPRDRRCRVARLRGTAGRWRRRRNRARWRRVRKRSSSPEGELEVSRIQTHRRGQPVTIKLKRKRGTPVELDASYGNAGHAAADASIERHRRWLERNPDQKLRAAAHEDRRRVVRSEVQRARHGAAGGHGDAPPPGTAAGRRRAHDLARQRGALPALTPEQRRARGFVGQVDGAAPVQSIVDIVEMLADLVDASMPVPS